MAIAANLQTPARGRVSRTEAAGRGAGLQWSSARRQYRGANGQWLGPLQVRAIIDQDIAAAQLRLRNDALEYQRGVLSYEAWEAGALREIKRLHIAHHAAARGGFHKLTQADYGAIGGKLKSQYRYFNRLRREIAHNPQYPQSRRFPLRIQAYAKAARVTYEQARQKTELAGGAVWARRILHALESCAGCQEGAALGWVRAETITPIGGYECNVHCLCTIEYSTSAAKPK